MVDNSKEAKSFALEAAELACQRHCRDIVVLDLQGISPATDYFVIATGSSNRQIKSVADEISVAGRENGFPRFGKAGYDNAKWVLLDFVDVVVHIFSQSYREYYDLEMLWGDAKQLKVKDIATEDKEVE